MPKPRLYTCNSYCAEILDVRGCVLCSVHSYYTEAIVAEEPPIVGDGVTEHYLTFLECGELLPTPVIKHNKINIGNNEAT